MASSPITKQAKFARVDQGVDYQQTSPYMSIGDGTVIGIGHGWAGGTGIGVYVRLDKPITVNGTTYKDFYIAERNPLVKVGDKVKAGQALTDGGSAELGFANGTSPYAPLEGGLGAGTKPSQAGADFLTLVHSLGYSQGQSAPPVASTPTPTPTQKQPQDMSGLNSELANNIANIGQQGLAPLAEAPTTGQVDTSFQPTGAAQSAPYSTWQQIASQGPVSQDTLRLAQLASSSVNAAPTG